MFRSRLVTVIGATTIAVVATVAITVALTASDMLTIVSMHGLIALGIGIGGTILLTAFLLVLVFHSNRAGYDDRASRSEE